MAVYYRFGPSDIIHYNLSTTPRIIATSGSSGWAANTGVSASVSMYGGIRGKVHPTDDFKVTYTYQLETHSIDGLITLSGSYPTSGSLTYVRCRNATLDLNDTVHAGLWGEEHFSPIMNLYDYYRKDNTDYTTGSYDYNMLYSEASSINKVTLSGSIYNNMTGSFAIEAMIKPLSVSGTNEDYTIASRTGLWSFYITGSNGLLAFSASDGYGSIHTSSVAVTKNRWNHVVYTVRNNTGSFLINLQGAGETVGITGSNDVAVEPVNVFFNERRREDVFHGFIFDLKLWSTGRTWEQLSASFDRTLINSSSTNLVTYLRFNDGPRGDTHSITVGSGAFDYSSNGNHGLLQNFDARTAPIWHPNDNHIFITPKKLIPNTINDLQIVHVPSMFYGRQIATGSVELVCNAYLSSSLQRTIVDDGRGGLYLSGSVVSGTIENRESYAGVQWNKVGNVFYSEGLIVIKDQSLLDFGSNNSSSPLQNALLKVNFKGKSNIPTKVFMCRIHGAQANASNNASFVTFDSGSDKHKIVRDDNTTYITAVGLYNEERKLVAVAKLASPIRNREVDKLNIRLKCDF